MRAPGPSWGPPQLGPMWARRAARVFSLPPPPTNCRRFRASGGKGPKPPGAHEASEAPPWVSPARSEKLPQKNAPTDIANGVEN